MDYWSYCDGKLFRKVILVGIALLLLPLQAGAFDLMRHHDCVGFADRTSLIAKLRDGGIKQEVLIEKIKKSEYPPEIKGNIIYNIEQTYIRTDLTPDEVYKSAYKSCMNPVKEI